MAVQLVGSVVIGCSSKDSSRLRIVSSCSDIEAIRELRGRRSVGGVARSGDWPQRGFRIGS